jgi:glucuronate isomerase
MRKQAETGAGAIKTVSTDRLYRKIAHQLSELITAGEFASGERLPSERELASQLGVSRPSVREALIALEVKGIVEIRVGAGVFVTSSSKDAAVSSIDFDEGEGPFELLQARRIVEGETAVRAASTATAADIAKIRAAAQEMRQAQMHGKITEDTDRAFHLAIAKAAHNSPLATLVQMLWDQGRGSIWKQMAKHFETPELRAEILRHHDAILEAIEDRNPKEARLKMCAHLDRVFQGFSDNGESSKDEAGIRGAPAKLTNTEDDSETLRPLVLYKDRLFPPDPTQRAIAQKLYEAVRGLPIVSPHGHTDPRWFAANEPFADPAALLIIPDHYIYRMLYSQGVPLEDLGVPRRDGQAVERDSRRIWRLFAKHWHLFRGTPSRMWFNHSLHDVFKVREQLSPQSADRVYDHIAERLASPEYRPRALFESFNIESLATTESPLDTLEHHRTLASSGWQGRIITTFRPDPVVDPDQADFAAGVKRLGELTGEDTHTWTGYLKALADRRAYFAEHGATATDHGHPSAMTSDLTPTACEKLFARVTSGKASPEERETFRGQMLTEMARMSIEDGLVMQLHPGAFRNHNPDVMKKFGLDKGADIPTRTDYVHALKPLLDRFGNDSRLSIILFTLDESAYSRELATLAGHYPVLKLGPSWWFHDSPEGMRRYRESVTETAGFYNTVGFNDDTRAFPSIPARHDVARRVDCAFLARLVAEHRLEEDEAAEVAVDLAYRLVKRAYKLGG